MVSLNAVHNRHTPNRSHGRRSDAVDRVKSYIDSKVKTGKSFDWRDKFFLADKIVADYGIPIGEANQMIERYKRVKDGIR